MDQTASNTIAKRVVINLDRCIECRSCAAACYASHSNFPVISFARSGAALLPVICRQCKSASCVDACPVEAMVRDDNGVVRRRMFRCIGCGSCARACPFGLLPVNTSGNPLGFRSMDRLSGHQIAKCDLCEDRTAREISPAVPRCVAACPTGALSFVDEHQAEAEHVVVLGGRTTGETPFKRR